MGDSYKQVRREWIVGLLVFLLVTVWIFSPALFSNKSLFAGDAPGMSLKEYVPKDLLAHYVGSWGRHITSLGDGYGATALNPLRLYVDLVSFAGKRMSMTYIMCCVLVFLGAIYYLRALGVATKRTLAPAMALAFAGYSFTLIKAGHIGFFEMMAYAVFVFGFLHRAITRRSLLHYALAGTFVVWAISVQPDMMMPITILLATYALLLCGLSLRGMAAEARRQFIIRTALGVVVGVVFFAIFGIGTFGFIFETIAPQRSEEVGKTPEQKWIFATNWSLPADEAAELVCPNVFGIDSENREVPYWGKLGRPHEWEKNIETLKSYYQRAQTEAQRKAVMQQYGRVMASRNFRQHTVYQGVVQVAVALLALLLAIFGMKKGEGDDKEGGDLRSLRPYIFFWSAIAVVSLLFAFGRYAPFYRLVYMMPVLKNMRAPVKYLRIVEICLAFLLGLGLEAAWRCRSREETNGVGVKRPYIVVAIVCGLSSLAFLLALVNVAGMPPSLKAEWDALGLGNQSEALMNQMVKSLAHSAILFAVVAAGMILALRKKTAGRVLRWLPWAVLALVSIDVASVGRNFIFVKDKSAFYAKNPIADIINQGDPLKRTDNLFIPHNKLNPISHNWVHHGVVSLRPSSTRHLKSKQVDYFDALKGHDKRLWLLTGTGYVMLPREGLARYAGQGLEEITGFTIEGERYAKVVKGKGPLVLCSVKDSLPYASVYHSWRAVSTNTVLSELTSKAWNPHESVLVTEGDDVPEGAGSEGVSPASVVTRGHTRIEITAEVSKEGILLVNESYHPDVVVKVDGKRAALLECNGVMRGVHVDPGKHTIVFTYRPYFVPLALNIAATLVLLGWVGVATWTGSRKRT